MADENRCPICGAELSSGTPPSSCPRCTTQAEAGAVNGGTAASEPTEPAGPDLDATWDPIHGPTAVAVTTASSSPADATGDWGNVPGGPTITAGGNGNGRNSAGLPRGTSIRYFGDYEIRRELGRGGMGVVYEARQASLNRPVALKMVKAGLLADDEELRRFRNEAEAVALLDHPGIVPVYEVGEHEGQQYFSMKLVEGGSLVALLDRYRDDPRAAASLAAEAAEAVAHAHMRGILHRDLKPANLLVDAAGHPHVTDFGLAKRVEADVELTASGAILGTPAYMSPEQAEGRRGSITTATDVYGLGAVLYALLTGKSPFGGDSVLDTLDAVRNAPPEPPTRVNAKVPRDLETICLKCLEKDPRRRYATAQALADDLRAWLDNRPIAARRVGATERAWLWCKRRPAIAALTAAVVLALLGGTAAVIATQARANAALQRKNAELSVANARIESERSRAEANFRRARAAVDEYFTTVSESKLLNVPGLQPLRKELLESALQYYESFLRERADDRSVLAEAAASLFRVAQITALVAKSEDAEPLYRRAIGLYEDLARDRPDDPALRSDLAMCHSTLGLLLDGLERDDEAMAEIRAALDLRDQVVRARPADLHYQADLARSHRHLGDLHRQVGEFEAAEANWLQARAIQEAILRNPPPKDPERHHLTGRGDVETVAREDLADILLDLSGLLRELGRWDEALENGRRASELLEAMIRERPDDPELRAQLAGGYSNLALTTLNLGRTVESLALSEKAIAILEPLVAANPSVNHYRGRLADAHLSAGFALERLGRDEVLRYYRRATELAEAMHAAEPDSVYPRSLLAQGLLYESRMLIRAGRLVEALPQLRRAQDLQEAIVRDHPRVVFYRFNLAFVCRALGRAEEQSGHPDAALAAFDRARRLDADEAPRIFIARYNEACDLALMARVAPPGHRQRFVDEAVKTLRQAIAQGYRSYAEASNDPDLSILLGHPEFEPLVLDLAFPAEPFAR